MVQRPNCLGIRQTKAKCYMHSKRQRHTRKHTNRIQRTPDRTQRSGARDCGCSCSDCCNRLADGSTVTTVNIFDDTSVSNYMIHPAATLYSTHVMLRPYRPWCVHTARRALRALRVRRDDGTNWLDEHIEYFERLLARHDALVQQAVQQRKISKH
jgi:hypothetical protein